MSDEPQQSPEEPSAPTPETPVRSSASSSPGPAGDAADIGRFWVKFAGWLVICLGAVSVISALHFSTAFEMPRLIVVGMLLMGGSYILAGQALSEGYAWSLPLCVLSPLSYGGVLPAIVLGVLAFKFGKPAVERGLLRTGVTDHARTAAVLWLAGFTCATLGMIFTIR